MPRTSGQAKKPLRWHPGIGHATTLLVFLAIAAARMVYVSLYASALPFWDQWDELNLLFRPWHDGTWHWLQLFSAHNEHRIALTRILGLLLFEGNGHTFDNLVECYANAFLYAGMWSLAYALLSRHEENSLHRCMLALGVIALGALPFDWENTLVGFQSQFYFMEMAAIGAVGIAAYCRPSTCALAMLACLCVAGLFTMGSGVLAAPAVCVVMVLLAWRDRTALRPKVATIMVMLAITAMGLLSIPHVPSDARFASNGLAEHIHAMLVVLAWPLQSFGRRGLLLAAVVWMPTVLWCLRFLGTARASDSEIFIVGTCAWVLLQFLAIAHARGHGIQAVPSRYTEIPAIGIACNAWLALKLMDNTRNMQLLASTAIAVGFAMVGYVFYKRTPSDHQAMIQRHSFSVIETWHVRNALSGRGLPASAPGSLEIPYPSSSRLQYFLSLPDMRAILPGMLLPPLERGGNAPLSRLSDTLQHAIRRWSHTPRFTELAATATQSTASRGYCALDSVSPGGSFSKQAEVSLYRGDLVQLTGWYVDSLRSATPSLSIILAGSAHSYAISASTNILRTDVARALHSPAAMHAGYRVAALLAPVEAGTYPIVQASNTSAPASTYDSGRELRVLP